MTSGYTLTVLVDSSKGLISVDGWHYDLCFERALDEGEHNSIEYGSPEE